MKVFQLVTKRQFRGAEVFAATLTEQLVNNGLTVFFIGLYVPPEMPLAINGALNMDFNGRKKFLSFSILKDLINLIKKERPDVIQANGSDTLKYAVIAKLVVGFRAPIIYRNISMVSAWVGNSFFKRKFYAFLFSKIDFITSVGKESINDLVRLFNFPVDRTMVIRRGIPIAPVDKSEARSYVQNLFNLRGEVKLVVHAGNFSPEKNQEFLLDVFTIIKKEQPEIKLILLGNGERFSLITESIQTMGLDDTVYLTGFRRDIHIFLAAADLFVLCSKIEGVPGVILEAAAQKTPSIAVNVGGVSEVIKNNESGIILSDFDAGEFSSAITELLYDQHRLHQYAENAYAIVRENFNVEKNADIFVQLYKRLI